MEPEELIRRHVAVPGFRKAARRALPRAIFDFTDGAAEDELTLRWNEESFLHHQLLPRPLEGAASRDLSVELFGKKLAMPLLIGPTGLSGMLWPDGELCAQRAAMKAGIGFCLSHASTIPIDALPAPSAGLRWMQVFVYRDRGFTRTLAERAQAQGYDGLVLTIDNQVPGRRERDVRNHFTIPPRYTPRLVTDMALHPGWLWRMRERRDLTFANYRELGGDMRALASRMAGLLDPAMTWADVAAIRGYWRGPLILKGVLHPGDIEKAIDHGVDGVILSNHGGRQQDRSAAGLTVLPACADEAKGRIRLLVDGGVRRGTDILLARALGADACLIARPHLWALATAGEAGVSAVLEMFRRGLDNAMALCGLTRITDASPDLLFQPAHEKAARP